MGSIMRYFRNPFTNHLIYLLFATFSIYPALEAKNGEWCDFCDAPEHPDEDSLCRQCGKKVKDCDFYHSVADPNMEDLAEKIMNSSDIESLIQITMKIRDVMRNENIFMSVDEISDMTIKHLIENGVPIQKNHVHSLKQMLNVSAFRASVARSAKKPTEPELPREVKFGYLITYAGYSMTVLPWKAAKVCGKFLMSCGGPMVVAGYYDYGNKLNDYYASLEEYEQEVAREKAEKEARDAAKEARDAEKKARKEAEKAEKKRQKEIEKQKEKEEKEERRRQKEERRKQ